MFNIAAIIYNTVIEQAFLYNMSWTLDAKRKCGNQYSFDGSLARKSNLLADLSCTPRDNTDKPSQWSWGSLEEIEQELG